MLRIGLGILAAALFALPALAADEEWMVVGGDGTAVAYDRASVKKAGDIITFRQGGYSIAPIPAPATIGGSPYNGLVGEVSVNCKDRTAKTGATTFILVSGVERALDAPPAAKFAPVVRGDTLAYFLPIVCDGRPPIDPHMAIGRKEGLALMQSLARQQRITASAGKGWTFAIAMRTSLTAIDTSSWKKTGDVVTQSEITWMREDQVNDGASWRYSIIPFEYDCVVGRRRANGMLQFFSSDNTLAHEEQVEAPWALLPPDSPGGVLFDMACKGRKLAGLPIGLRGPMIARLRELAVLD